MGGAGVFKARVFGPVVDIFVDFTLPACLAPLQWVRDSPRFALSCLGNDTVCSSFPGVWWYFLHFTSLMRSCLFEHVTWAVGSKGLFLPAAGVLYPLLPSSYFDSDAALFQSEIASSRLYTHSQ